MVTVASMGFNLYPIFAFTAVSNIFSNASKKVNPSVHCSPSFFNKKEKEINNS